MEPPTDRLDERKIDIGDYADNRHATIENLRLQMEYWTSPMKSG